MSIALVSYINVPGYTEICDLGQLLRIPLSGVLCEKSGIRYNRMSGTPVSEQLTSSMSNIILNFHSSQELVKLIGPKYDPPQIVQERVLSLIQVNSSLCKEIFLSKVNTFCIKI